MRRHGKCLKLRLVRKRSRKRKVERIAVERSREKRGVAWTGQDPLDTPRERKTSFLQSLQVFLLSLHPL